MNVLPSKNQKRRRGKRGGQKQRAAEARRQNMLVEGAGANTTQDRGAMQRIPAQSTLSPYHVNNYIERSRQYLKMYKTSWEAQKMVTIPVDDALRNRAELKGISAQDAEDLWKAYEDRELDKQNRRALIQMRLFGGCVGFGVFKASAPSAEMLAKPLRLRDIEKGDFEALNVIDVTQLSLASESYNPFSAEYDKPPQYCIHRQDVDSSRLLILDGSPVVNRFSQSTLEGGRINPLGFSESILLKLYELMLMSTGTQESAYHLVNLASCLIVLAENFRTMKATNSAAADALRDLVENISIFRAAVAEGKGVQITQHAASFGSVPELMMMYMQFLSAAGDIPATRFLGQAPGGLNATGESDMQNYHAMVRSSVQIGFLKPIQLREFDWIGCSLWGYEKWMAKRQKFDIEYPPLWDETAKEKADRAAIYAAAMNSMVANGIISGDAAVKELLKQGFFMTEMEAMDAMADPLTEDSPIDPGASIAELGRRGIPQAAIEANAEKKTENSGDWDEDKHPRGDDGRFGKGGKCEATQDSNGDDLSEVSEWGEAFKEFSGKPAEAIEHLMKEKRGYVPAAFHREETGPIDLPYGKSGKEGFGIAHIVERRNEQGYDGEAFVRDLPELISEGVYYEKKGFPNKRFIAHGGKEAVIRLDWNRKSRTWIASAYYLFNPEK